MTGKMEASTNEGGIDIRVQYPPETEDQTEDRILPKPLENGKKKLVIVLLGWAGAEHKYLSKYSDFYLKRGCIVMHYITPLRYHFIGLQKLPDLAREILKYIHHLKLADHPIFFHVFSNGGGNTYSYIIKENQDPQSSLHVNIEGTIFDSAPSPRSVQTAFSALVSIFSNHNIIIRYGIACLTATLMISHIFWFFFKLAITFCIYGETLDSLENPDRNLSPLFNWLENIARTRNHHFLFLYSDKDDLIPADSIERFAKICESRGNRVKKMRFEGSEHVMHFRRYPEEYGKAVIDFIRGTMMHNE